MALTIRINGGPFHGGGYDSDTTESHNLSRYGYSASYTSSNPRYSQEPDRITGTPQDDQIVFEWENKSIFHQLHMWHGGVFSEGVTQTRLANGLIVAEAVQQGEMCRFCWTHADRVNSEMGQYVKRVETATGLAVISGLSLEAKTERWSITLYRADFLYCEHHNELEPSVHADCGAHPRGARDDPAYVFGEVGET